ncbi:MAG: DUF4153 domain-containing protein [Eubacteriales bacterium]|nr:DUF4153 domain-containing protein [Eubacteriales bacterium]
MNTFTRSIVQIFKGAARAFQTFPATIASALAFAAVTMIRIQLDYPIQDTYQEIITSLQWSLALSGVLSMAAITGVQSRINQRKAFLFANLLGAVVFAVTFLALYLPADLPTGLALSRVGVAILVSLLAFMVLSAYPPGQSDFARAFFMTHKAFFIALIYGLVIMGGTSGVAGAIKALIYRDLSEKVFMHIATLSGVLAFTLFVGYFPDFRKGVIDERRETAQKQPRFIEILLGYITIPIALALTVVLLVWTGRVVITSSWPQFTQLASIATAYTIGGIWLHILVTAYETGLARFYRRIYPVAALLILVFEAWALVVRLRQSGLKMTEYSFALIWLIALVAAVLLLVRKARAHVPIIALICLVAVISVLPVLGYHALPVTAQASRLENLLADQGMLADGQIQPAATEPDRGTREAITDAVLYLAYAEDASLPEWFDPALRNTENFRSILGFEQVWADYDPGMPFDYSTTFLALPEGVIPITGYHWAISLQNQFDYGVAPIPVTLEGQKGRYTVSWSIKTNNNLPSIKIMLGDAVLVDQTLADYAEELVAKYPLSSGGKQTAASLDDMTYEITASGLEAIIVFNSIELTNDNGQMRYYFYPAMLFVKEN